MIVVRVEEENRRANVAHVDVRLEVEIRAIEGAEEDKLEIRQPTEWLSEFVLPNLYCVSRKVIKGRERPRRS